MDRSLNAFAEVEKALANEAHLKQREEHLNRAATQARAAQMLAEDRYNQGVDSYLSVLEAQRRAINSESERISVQARRLTNRVDLYLALGGGFEYAPQLSQPVLALD